MKKLTYLLFCLILGIGLATAQTTKVTGTVISADDNEPIIGASIVVKGTMVGTVTDFDGAFSLDVPSSAKTLVVSYVGMETQEISVKPQIRVLLQTSSQALEEVMVVAYGTAKKASFTGSAKAVNAEEIVSGSKESLDKALAGKLTGVRVTTTTGDPGSPGEINIRGVGSISASKSPLYVIDGVPVKNDSDMSYYGKTSSILSSLNPDDIENMTVLKDAAAASLYGSRAANGVIIITTKSGKKGKTKVSYTGEVGWSNMAVKQFVPMTASQILEYGKEALSNYYILNGDATNRDEAYAIIDSEGDMASFFNDPSGKTDTNWRDEVYRTALTQDHQVAISGGADKTQFYVGFGYNKSEGIVIGTDFERLTGRLNLDHQVNDWLSFGVKQSIAYSKQAGGRDQGSQEQGIGTSSPLSLVFSSDPTAPVKNPDGSYNENANWGAASNPHLMLGIDQWIKSKTMRSLTNADVQVKLSDKVTFKSILGYDFIDTKHFEYWSPNSVDGESVKGLGSRYNYENRNLTSSSTLRYANLWNDVHSFDVLGGFEVENQQLTNIIATAKQYSTDKLPELGNGQPDNAYSNVYESGLVSYLATANYNYDNRYYLSASFRRDGSSRLGADNRWANFWSVSAAWRLTQENFMKDLHQINDLKVRASYGINGTLPNSLYEHLSLYGYGYNYQDIAGSAPVSVPNPDLSWEKNKNFNIGFDGRFFDRVSVSFDYYSRKTTDLLQDVPTSMVVGFKTMLKNVGEMTNKGVEVDINVDIFKDTSVKWTSGLALSHNSNKISKLYEGKDIIDGTSILREGESYYSWWSREWAGVDPQTGEELWVLNTKNVDGSLNKELTTDPAKAQRVIIGKPDPKLTGGWRNSFSWNGLELNMLFNFSLGGKVFDTMRTSITDTDGYGIFYNSSIDQLDRWQKPGDKTDVPRRINNYQYGNYGSSRFMKDLNYLRLKSLSLSYTLPSRWIRKAQMENVRLFVSGSNLLTWTSYKNVDPEQPINGIPTFAFPTLRSVTFGIEIGL